MSFWEKKKFKFYCPGTKEKKNFSRYAPNIVHATKVETWSVLNKGNLHNIDVKIFY